jgi:hypothetical protein
MTRSGRPALVDPKIAAPIRLRKSILDQIRAIGSVQEFVEAAVLDSLEKHNRLKSDTTSTNQP